MSRLFVIGTPIGNLSDLTPRAKAAFEACDVIAAEDTRVSSKLLSHMQLKKPLVSLHRHNEDSRTAKLIERASAEDITIALCCDAGTPGISDPGHMLVAAAWDAGIPVEPIPGASAVVTALSVSGFDSREFAFYGFLPRENKALNDKLAEIRDSRIRVSVLFESPHRVVELMKHISTALPRCKALVCCDLTKRFELIYRGYAEDVLTSLSENPNVEKGEYCVVIDAAETPPRDMETPRADAASYMLSILLDGATLDEAAANASQARYKRNDIYAAKLSIRRFLNEGK